jgi:predicted cation transporter
LAWRGLKAYLFVAGLVLLGQGFAPAAERWLLTLPTGLLYWANLSSAILDNATLAAAEVGPRVPPEKLRALLMGLMISGGMLIPGNVPNIVCASKLKLRAKDWARFGVPLGLALMLIAYLPILLQR